MAPYDSRVQPKAPPHSMEAEQSVLGALLLTPRAWETVEPILRAEDFYRHDHQQIFAAAAVLHRAGKACDFVTVAEAMGRAEAPAEYLASLATDLYSIANVESYARIVKEHSGRRALIAAAAEIGEAAYRRDAKSFAELASAAQQSLYAISERGRDLHEAQTFAQVTDQADRAIQHAIAVRKAGGLIGVPTGIRPIDDRTGGLCGSQLVVLAARPSIGKSALLSQIGIHAARTGHPGLICSLEMSAEQIGIRAMAHAAGVNVTKLRLGYDDERERACAVAAELGGIPLYLDTDTYELSAICAQIAHYRRKYGIKWAAVDHIGLVDVDSYNSRNDQLGKITKELKRLSKKLDIAIIAVSQLNRNVEKDRRKPMLADLRDSGSIEQDAVAAIFLHTDADDSDKKIDVQIGILKNRDGRRGWIDTVFEFDGATQTFHETDRRFERPLRVSPIRAVRDGKSAAAGDA